MLVNEVRNHVQEIQDKIWNSNQTSVFIKKSSISQEVEQTVILFSSQAKKSLQIQEVLTSPLWECYEIKCKANNSFIIGWYCYLNIKVKFSINATFLVKSVNIQQDNISLYANFLKFLFEIEIGGNQRASFKSVNFLRTRFLLTHCSLSGNIITRANKKYR